MQTGAANPFNGIIVSAFSTPTLADIDGDGDLDAVVGNSVGTLRTFLNPGTGVPLTINVTPENDAADA